MSENRKIKEVLVDISDVLKSVDEDLLLSSLLYKVDPYGGIIDLAGDGKFVLIITKNKEVELKIKEFITSYNKLFNKNIKIIGDENE